MDFCSVASGSGGNCYVVEHGGSRLLLECGLGRFEIHMRLNYGLAAMEGCLLSHEHGDHACGAEAVIRAGVDVFASRGTLDALRLSGHRAQSIEARHAFQVGPFRVLPFAAIHDAAEPLGFVIGAGTDRLLYLSDSAYSPHRFVGLTLIAVEANWSRDILWRNVERGLLERPLAHRIIRTHMSLERVLKLLSANDLSRLRETWLLHLSDGNSDEAAFRTAVQRATGRPVHVAAA